MKATALDRKVGGVAEPDPKPWWQEGVMARLDPGTLPGAEDLRLLGNASDGLGIDALVLRPASPADGEALVTRAGELGVRVLIELSRREAHGTSEAVAATTAWLDRGAAGVAVDLADIPVPERPKVTRLFGGRGRSLEAQDPLDAVRRVVDERDRVLVARRTEDGRGPARSEPHVVIETALARQPWRAASVGRAIDAGFASLPAGAWPGWELGAPRRGPFAVGLSADDAFACSAALHLTLWGTPCIPLGDETGLPRDDRRRAWYRRLLDLRRSEAALHRGGLRRLAQEKSVLGYLREYEAERLLVLLNLGRRGRTARLPTGFAWTVLLGIGPPEGRRLAGGAVSLPGCGLLIARAGAPQSRTLGTGGQRRATGP